MGDGCAAYPLNGLPILDEETLCAVFDISEKQLKNTSIRRLTMPEMLNVGDTDPDERVLKDDDFSIIYGGTEVKPLKARNGIPGFRHAHSLFRKGGGKHVFGIPHCGIQPPERGRYGLYRICAGISGPREEIEDRGNELQSL